MMDEATLQKKVRTLRNVCSCIVITVVVIVQYLRMHYPNHAKQILIVGVIFTFIASVSAVLIVKRLPAEKSGSEPLPADKDSDTV